MATACLTWAAWAAAWTCNFCRNEVKGKGPRGPFSFVHACAHRDDPRAGYSLEEPALDIIRAFQKARRTPPRFRHGQVAQLVEQRTENPCVGGSIPPLATNIISYRQAS